MKKLLAIGVVLTLAGTSLGACTPASRSASSGGRWMVSRTVRAGERLGGLACPSTRFCVVADGNDVLQTSNGGASWSSQRSNDGDTIGVVSCATPRSCWAIGSDEGNDAQYFMREGADSSWARATRRVDDIEPTVMTSISCPTTGRCVAVGDATLLGGNAGGYPLWIVKDVRNSVHPAAT